MSAPQAVALPGPGGAKGVTATITWKSCTGLASPAYSEVCVSSPTSNGRCSKRIGWDSPQAIFPTPNPAGPFTAQARGCYRTPSEASLVCDTQDQSATLSAGGALPNLPIGGAAPLLIGEEGSTQVRLEHLAQGCSGQRIGHDQSFRRLLPGQPGLREVFAELRKFQRSHQL